jgi:hypothetical protein
VIAHVAGLPFEETIPHFAPMILGTIVAVRLLRERARSWARRLDPRRHPTGSSVVIDSGGQSDTDTTSVHFIDITPD